MKANHSSFRLAMLALLSTERANANDNSLTNFLSAANWYNLEQAELPNGLKDALVHETANGENFIYNEGLEGEDYHVA